jgi:hypothetical protein
MHFLGNLQLPLNSAGSEPPGRNLEKSAGYRARYGDLGGPEQARGFFADN